jgi:cytochrome c peroxidase
MRVALPVALLVLARVAAGQPLPAVPVPPQNPITEAKRVLGKILFWDEQLSSDNTVACGTCHRPSFGGADPRLGQNPGPDGAPGTGDDVAGSPGMVRSDAASQFRPDDTFGLLAQVTRRAANPFFMTQFAPSLFWDGRAPGEFRDPQNNQVVIPVGGALESQAVAPPLSDVEMGHEERDWDQVIAKLQSARPLALARQLPPDLDAAVEGDPTYPELFASAFGDGQITARRIAFALATYQRTLLPDQTPFDLFVAGQPGALTPAQQQGLNVFLGPAARCSICHTPPFFTNHTFRNIGLRPWQEDPGRFEVTGNFPDRGRFKVPTLRNAGLKESFMHSGGLTTLGAVIDFYLGINGQVQFPENQDPLIPPIFIPPQARPNLIDFIANGLTDPRVAAETFPFDRPALHVEQSPPNPLLLGPGVPGAGGPAPEMIAMTPPLVGTKGFRLGVRGGPAGATAWLARASSPPAGGLLEPQALLGPFTLEGAGPGDGHATWSADIPNHAAVIDTVEFYQWQIEDPQAPGGLAASPVARLEYFCLRACPCIGDVDGDLGVGIPDLVAVVLAWGQTTNPLADVTGDGAVDVLDLVAVVSAWGPC